MITTDQLQIIKKPKLESLAMQEDYSKLVTRYTESFRIDDHYIYVGDPKTTQGWILHITVIPFQMEEMLEAIVPTLLYYNAPFKIIRNKDLHDDINAAYYGMYKVGKVITVFLDNEGIIESMVTRLKEKVTSFQGPLVTTDFFIGTNLYTRYGTFIPQIHVDAFGNNIRMIKDLYGNFYEDRYQTPPTIPPGIANPFVNIAAKPPAQEKKHLLVGKYFITSIIKSDVKGNVYKGLVMGKYLLPKRVIIKEGKKGIYPDAQGRDVRDRLIWQNKINSEFSQFIKTPKVLDYINEKDISYLVTEYISGARNLNHAIIKKILHTPWFSHPLHLQKEFLQYLLQIVDMTQDIHSKGYLHLDLTDNNFMVNSNKDVFAIDLELVYSKERNEPNPPFGLGTPGYMSPEQELRQSYTEKNDVYSIGALQVMIFSGGIEPAYLVDRDLPGLKEKMLFFTRDEQISELTSICLDTDPEIRPTLPQIKSSLLHMLERIDLEKVEQSGFVGVYSFEQVLLHGIASLAGDLYAHDELWFSRTENDYGWDAYPLGNKHFYSNIHQGLGGIIYFLSMMKMAGYDITATERKLNVGMDFVLRDITQRLDTMAPSLYYGKAGLAITISKLLSSKMLTAAPEYNQLIGELLRIPAEANDVIYGIAGQGLAILQCLDNMNPQVSEALLQYYANNLISIQRQDGGWNKVEREVKLEVITGFGYGVAGIVYFLLQYGSRFQDKYALLAAEKGLQYLLNKKVKVKEHYEWKLSNKTKAVGNWWCAGAPGIALAFLKSYEITNNKSHLKAAENALRAHPPDFVYYRLGQCHGIAGLGELYLEAYRITQKTEWIERATWIANHLYHFRKQPSEKEVYWLTERHVMPTANFMTGDSGVLHFLARFIHPDKFSFPFIG